MNDNNYIMNNNTEYLRLGSLKFTAIILLILFLTDISVLLDLSIVRQILTFIVVFIPGLLSVNILKLNKINFTEKFIICIGLSISLLLLFGLLFNYVWVFIGYEKPLSPFLILVSINILCFILLTVNYVFNKNKTFRLIPIKLNTYEKIFLIFAVQFPFLSIIGAQLVGGQGNNFILIGLLTGIPIYVVLTSIFNKRLSDKFYPISLFLISISIILILMFRFSHIYGDDIHLEYNFFSVTLNNLHWTTLGEGPIYSSLSVSLLPALLESLIKTNFPEYLFKFVFVFTCSFTPLIVYSISKKYTTQLNSFLAAFFFMSQITFINVAGSPRTNIALFFSALALLLLFNEDIAQWKKITLFLIFLFSVVLSHYATAYILLFLFLFIGISAIIYSKKYKMKRNITFGIVSILFIFIFLWYAMLTKYTFDSSIEFLKSTLFSLNNSILYELRSEKISLLLGQSPLGSMLSKANLIITWSTFIFIGIGVLATLKNYIKNLKTKSNAHALNMDPEFLFISILSVMTLFITIIVPYLSIGYDIFRVYALVTIILSIYFVIGGMKLAKYVRLKKSVFFVLIILILYFLFSSGVIYASLGISNSPVFNSYGKTLDLGEIKDSESLSIKWLSLNYASEYVYPSGYIYTVDASSRPGILSQSGGMFTGNSIDTITFTSTRDLEKGYIILSYYNIHYNKLIIKGKEYNLTDYSNRFNGTSKIYDNANSEIWFVSK